MMPEVIATCHHKCLLADGLEMPIGASFAKRQPCPGIFFKTARNWRINDLTQRRIPMNAEARLYRQGDLLLERIDELPTGLKEISHNGFAVLAEGENTVHQHVIKTSGVRVFADLHTSRATYVEIAEALALLEHEEHAPISLEKGAYRVTRQREYMPQRRTQPVSD